jgi:hypothetical protein
MRALERRRRPSWLLLPIVVGVPLLLGFAWAGQPISEGSELTGRLVAMIEGRLAGDDTIGAGIIFGLGPDRLFIATANHVVRRGNQEVQNLRVQFRWLPGDRIEAKLQPEIDRSLDLAVLSVATLPELRIPQSHNLRFDRLADAGAMKRGDPVYSIGYPNARPWHMRVVPDTISETSSGLLRFESVSLAQGHSGGALLNARGQVVGMIRRDEPPDGEAVSIGRIVGKLREWGYPVHLSEVDIRDEIRALLDDYKRAIESEDLTLYRQVRPGVTDVEVGKLTDSFRHTRSHTLDLMIENTTITTEEAKVQARQRGVHTANDGQRRTYEKAVTFNLKRTATGWVIVAITP